MATVQEQRATLAMGRWLIRISNWVLGITAAVMVAGIGAILLAMRAGRLDDQDATPAVIGLIPITASTLAFFVLAFTGRRMVRRSIADVAAHPDQEPPEALRVGPASPWSYAAGTAVFLGLAIVGPAFLVTPSKWLCPALVMASFLIQLGWQGPSGLGLFCADLDATGIKLPELGIHVPWTSVRHMEVTESGVRIGVEGPVVAQGLLPAVWRRRAIARLNREGGISLSTNRQEQVKWTALRYIDCQHDTQSPMKIS